jgi:hemerythrin-like domain-containing protein
VIRGPWYVIRGVRLQAEENQSAFARITVAKKQQSAAKGRSTKARVSKKRAAASSRQSRAASKTARRKTAARAAASSSTARKSAGGAKKAAPKKGSAKKAGAKKTATRKTAARSAAAQRAPRSRLAEAAATVRGTVAGAVQAVAGSLPWSADENDPIALLESDHRRFEDLLKQGEETTARAVKGRTALLDALTAALNVHEVIEEQVLYPALKPHAEARDIVLEGFQEHHVADLLVKELHDLAKDDEQWGAKFKVLQESLEHHIEEEEGTMFPTAREVFSGEELEELGRRMRALKAQTER